MPRFTIRDLLWLTALVAVAIAWLMDRNAVRRERAKLAKREAELTSRAKMWEAEAHRAEKRAVAPREVLDGLYFALQMRGIKLSDLIDSKNNPIHPSQRQKPIFIDDATR